MAPTRIPPTLRDAVRERAGGFCEYCRYPDATCYAAFHCDHCIAEATGGATTFENLAWACPACNSSKGAAMDALDPQAGTRVPLFNPRHHLWSGHFQWSQDLLEIVGLTPTGRATAARLRFNREKARVVRSLLVELGRHPGAHN
jgi:hypothetical protein